MSSMDGVGRRGRTAEDQVQLNDLPNINGIKFTQSRTPATKPGAESEKQPFLPKETRTAAWEDSNLRNDERNFKEMEKAQPEMDAPRDRMSLVYMTLLLHGVGTLMPWNMFINAKDYFVDYKLSKNYTGEDSEYVTNFIPYLGWAAQVPNLIFNWLNIFVQMGGSLKTRIVYSLLLEVVMFVATILLAIIDSSTWPGVFFWVTMASVVVINMANGIYQNTVYGMAAKLPFTYTGAVVLGSNVCGTFVSLISIISTAFAPDSQKAAIYYFLTALFILLACVFSYLALPLNRFYRYHEMMFEKGELEKKKNNHGVAPKVPFYEVFMKCYPQCLNVFLVFFFTITVFPTVLSDVAKSDQDFFINDKYYSLITCYLTFNLSACVGSLFSTFFTWPSPKYVIIPVLLRIVFVPFFLLCNYQPSYTNADEVRMLPVLILNEWVYWGAGVLLGLTSGYFSAVSMMYCPRTVGPEHAATAGMFGAASIMTGIFAGVTLASVMSWFVAHVSWDWLGTIGQIS